MDLVYKEIGEAIAPLNAFVGGQQLWMGCGVEYGPDSRPLLARSAWFTCDRITAELHS
jgi:hypothetical protein